MLTDARLALRNSLTRLRGRMAQTDSFIALPRTAVAIVPMLMLPILIGAGWLIVSPHSMTGRSAIIIGAIAVGLYLLGG